MVITARTVTLIGAVGHVVDVQVDATQGSVGTHLVGRPDAAITDSQNRCRPALQSAGRGWPTNKRLTISLSPADIPKRGPHFDLAIALAVLWATDPEMAKGALDDAVFIGELTLDGRLRSVPGVLPMVMAAAARGVTRAFVPEPQAEEASWVPGMTVRGVRSVGQLISHLCGLPEPDAPPVAADSAAALLTWRGAEFDTDLDMADMSGVPDARLAMEVCAAGGHSLLLSGPKGAGKTSLAERLPSLLPDLEIDEALELTAVHSLAGSLSQQGLIRRPPFRSPHHSASCAGVLGGGSGRTRPGEVSKAHLGVLFLDEFPLFQRDVIEALRQPLESGLLTISRGEEEATYPARCLVVLAANPCPCGEFHPFNPINKCTCADPVRRRYREKLSGPIADRIDITRHVAPVSALDARDAFAVRESSATIRERVSLARERQRERYADDGWRLNAHVPGPELSRRWPLVPPAAALVDAEVFAGRLTRRGAVRVHRVCLTLADLRGLDSPGVDEARLALALRTGASLPTSALPQAAAFTATKVGS